MKQIEQYKKMSKKEFINMMEEIYPDDAEIDVHVLNFNKGQKISSKKTCNKTEVTIIADESKSIIYSGNQFFAHVDLHSAFQPDIMNIKPEGIMKTIML